METGKYYDDIIRTKENSYVIRENFVAVTESFVDEFIGIIVEDIPDWQYRYIVNQDYFMLKKRLYANSVISKDKYGEILGGNMLSCTPEELENRAYGNILDYTDFTGKLKAINYRFLRPLPQPDNGGQDGSQVCRFEDGEAVKAVESFFGDLRDLRNRFVGHLTPVMIVQMRDADTAVGELERIREKLELNIHSGNFRNALRRGEKCHECAERYLAETREFINDFTIARKKYNPCEIEDKKIGVEYMLNSNIFIDCSAFNSEYWTFMVTSLGNNTAKTKNKLFVYGASIKALRDQAEMDKNPLRRRNAKTASKVLKQWQKDGNVEIMELEGNSNFGNDALIEKLRDKEDYYIIITDDVFLAKRVSDMGKENICAVRIADTGHVEVFLPNGDFHAEEIVEESADGFNADELPEELYSDGDGLSDGYGEHISAPTSVYTPFTVQAAASAKPPLMNPTQNSYVKYIMPGEQPIECRLREVISGGGEGTVYSCDIGDELIKIYMRGKLDGSGGEELSEKIGIMVGKYQWWLNQIQNNDRSRLAYFKRVCLPKALIKDSTGNYFVGFSMNRAGLNAVTLEEKLNEISGSDEEYTRKNIVDLCKNIAKTFETLHSLNILVGDVNLKNIMVDDRLNAYFIDTDSYQFDRFMCTVGTADFTSPMMYRKFGKESGSGVRYGKVARTAEDEAFACAVLYFKILFLTYSPYSVSDTNGIAMCIKNGDFRFKTDGKAQTRHNYRWLNLSRGIRQMFKNVFRENPVFYSDSEWINAFEEMWDEIGDHKLSNLITPDDAITDGDGLWHDETCRICHKTYEAAHKIEFDRLCPDCKCKRAINRKRIRRAVCSCCGSEFTVNEWDAAGMDLNSIMCPDCDRRMRVPKQNQAENESDFIAKQMNRALKNLFEL